MKRQGTMLTSTEQQKGQHAFLFSLRSLDAQASRKLDVKLNFSQRLIIKCEASCDQTIANYNCFDPSTLLPCFSKGSETKLNAFYTVSEQITFQKENVAIVEKLAVTTQPLREDKEQIMEARPRSQFCQICKETFSDYLKHLQHPVHIKKFEIQCKNSLIDGLVKNLETEVEAVRRDRRIVNEQEEECRSAPYKIRVIQLQDTLTPMRCNASSLQCFPK